VLLAVYVAQAIYVAVGIMLQVRAPQKVLLARARGASRVYTRQSTPDRDRKGGGGGKYGKEEIVPGQRPDRLSSEGSELQEIAVDISDVQQQKDAGLVEHTAADPRATASSSNVDPGALLEAPEAAVASRRGGDVKNAGSHEGGMSEGLADAEGYDPIKEQAEQWQSHDAASKDAGDVAVEVEVDAPQKPAPAATLLAIWKVATNYIQVSTGIAPPSGKTVLSVSASYT
jgi:hypothetical protein